jgi:hypothetical protein
MQLSNDTVHVVGLRMAGLVSEDGYTENNSGRYYQKKRNTKSDTNKQLRRTSCGDRWCISIILRIEKPASPVATPCEIVKHDKGKSADGHEETEAEKAERGDAQHRDAKEAVKEAELRREYDQRR